MTENKYLGHLCTEQTKLKISLANKGKKHTIEAKLKMSIAKRGQKPWITGKHHSEESKTKMSIGKKGKTPWLGKHHSEESKLKMSIAHKNNKNIKLSITRKRLFKEGKLVPYFKGKNLSEETKAKISAASKGRKAWITGKHHSEESRMKMSIANLGKKRPDLSVMRKRLFKEGKIIIWNKGKKGLQKHSQETLKKMRNAHLGKRMSKEHNLKCSITKLGEKNPMWGKKHSDDFKKQVSLKMKEKFNDPNYVNKIRIAREIKPNIPEKKLSFILDKNFPNQWKYTGDFSFWIKNFNPDFVNCNGKKIIIEMYGDYWHNIPTSVERDEQRIKAYSDLGYKTIIVWEHELKDPMHIIEKILKEMEEK